MTTELLQTGCIEPSGSTRSFANILTKSFLASYLLTASLSHAERTVKAAIDLWDPMTEDEDELFQSTLKMAVSKQEQVRLINEPERTTAIVLPSELLNVLELSPKHRHCFVLRVLIGLPSMTCANLLRLSEPQVDRYSRWARKHLSAQPQ